MQKRSDMIKNILIVILLTITLLGDNAAETTPQIAQAAKKQFNIKQAQSVTYEVKITNDNNISGSGTAVAISSDGTLITAYHNIETYKSIKVIDNNSKEYAARVGNISVDNDLAYLYIDAKNIPYAKLSNELELGKDIYMLSYENLLLAGIVSQIKQNGIVLNIEAKRGTSGGGIFNEKNELVAVLLRKDILDKTSFATIPKMFTTITQKYKAKEELLNLDSNNYDYSFCEDEDELIIWNKYAKSKDPRIQEYHALFLGLCEKVKNRDLTTEHAQFIFEHTRIRLFGKD